MRISTLRVAAAALGCAAAFSASVSAASAAPAVFSSAGSLSMAFTSPVVVKIGTTPTPATTVTCTTVPLLTGTVTNTGSPLQGWVSAFQFGTSQCTTGTGATASVAVAKSRAPMPADKTGSAYSVSGTSTWELLIAAGSSYQSAPYAATSYSAQWVNGTGPSNPSVLTFSNAAVGRVSPGYPLAGQPISLSGSVSVTQGGGLLTLS
jgi:hypothetical protein